MKKTLIVLMLVLLSAMLMVSCKESPVTPPSDIKVGDIVQIGDVSWKALDVDTTEKRALLISQDVLELRAFDGYGSNVYKTSTIRTYLNDNFITAYGLSKDYMKKVVFNGDETIVSDSGEDYVFLLSLDEAEKYFESDEARKAELNGTASEWWIRTVYSFSSNNVYSVDAGGDVILNGNITCANENGIRPAFWYVWN